MPSGPSADGLVFATLSNALEHDYRSLELVRGAKTVVTKVGTPGPDFMQGSKENNTFLTLGGNDTVVGGTGKDHMCGGRGRTL